MNSTVTSEPPTIRVYLLAQNRLVREVLVRLFRKRVDLTVAGAHYDAASVVEELKEIPIDVLLLDSLDVLRAVEGVVRHSENLRHAKIVVFGVEEDPDCFLKAIRLGASAYLPKDVSSTRMIAAVRSVTKGEAVCPPKLCKLLFEIVSKASLPNSKAPDQVGHILDGLTCRQRQLMALVAKGLTNKEIAASLGLSEFTVKNHIRRVMRHLRAGNRHQAVDVIRASGLSLGT
jgi:DNA-binding NarL/FixJ family response regulator